MKDCDKFENSIQSLIAGDPRLDQLEELVEHCKACRECRELFEMHRTLAGFGSEFDKLETVDLAEARRSIVEKVTAKGARRSLPGWMTALQAPFVLRPTVSVTLLAAFFALGMFVAGIGDRTASSVSKMSGEALFNASLRDMENPPYTFSNVTLHYLDDNKIALAFDVARHVAIVEPAHSKLVRGVLVNSEENPFETGIVGHFQTKSSGEPAQSELRKGIFELSEDNPSQTGVVGHF